MKFIKGKDKFNDLVLNYLNFLLIDKNYSKQTINSYENELNKYYSYLNKYKLNIEKITKTDLMNYTKYLNNLSNSSINHNISVIKSFYKYLFVNEGFSENPTEILETPRKEKNLPKVLSYEEIKLLLDVDLINKYSYRNKAMLELMYATGLRVSELVNLKLNNIDFDDDLLKTMGKGSKERIIPIGDYAMYYLKLYINEYRPQLLKKEYTDYIFLNNLGKNISRQSFFLTIKDLAVKKNIKTNFSPHTLRHSFATHLLDRGADIVSIKELLGHSSLATTQIYTHISNKKLQDDYSKFHPHG
ncbi:MAG: site-specific tyrosine recombinase XerD [Firmicutes bacterium]|nr:site-specific tyrosine recombinase XerD [Bacillota bacterium]